ncbi:MAG: sugar ABC transporter permease, partial [Pseudomonadota bacterium]
MSDIAGKDAPAEKRSLFKQLDIDTRLLGMIGAFAVLCLVFDVITDGRFLTPRNIFNLSVQTVSVAIMATGMVFVIVTRNIDLSVGSLLAVCSAAMAMVQTLILPQWLGLGLNHPATWLIAITAGLTVGIAIGAFQGWLIGYLAIPSFIVTLGGLLVWRNVAWYMTGGQTIGPLDGNFLLLGGVRGTLWEEASWVFAAVMSMAAIILLFRSRSNKANHGFTVKPLWAEGVTAFAAAGAIMGFIWILNSYNVPRGALRRMFPGGEVPESAIGLDYGLPISVLVLIVIAIVMTVVARRTRFGRYIFATGGNPDAAELSGINTRMLTVKVFALMGALCAVSAVVASARLANHTNDIGTLDELRVIAAAVIGGTALSGGIGTIYGAILGALIMQSLQSGMAMVGVDAPFQ